MHNFLSVIMPLISNRLNNNNNSIMRSNLKPVIIKIINIRRITINLISRSSQLNNIIKHNQITISHKHNFKQIEISFQSLSTRVICHMMAAINIATQLPMVLRLMKAATWRILALIRLKWFKGAIRTLRQRVISFAFIKWGEERTFKISHFIHMQEFQFMFNTRPMSSDLR